ncbi:MAG: PIN domain-containing protein [Actinobacteria bacterium]|jgi:Lon protease-like protein|nr:PIN domain-containing protein [Actinomycetota bacterium]
MSRQRRIVLDAGALIDVEANPRGETFRSCVHAFADGYRPYLPAVVLGQVWRGHPRQHALGKVRRLCMLLPFTGQTAEDVGRLLARSQTADVVDAAVIVAAIEHNAAVLTSDPDDLTRLTDAAKYPVRLLTV